MPALSRRLRLNLAVAHTGLIDGDPAVELRGREPRRRARLQAIAEDRVRREQPLELGSRLGPAPQAVPGLDESELDEDDRAEEYGVRLQGGLDAHAFGGSARQSTMRRSGRSGARRACRSRLRADLAGTIELKAMKLLRRLAGSVIGLLRTVPAVNRWYARTRSRLYERRVAGFIRDGSGRADRLPQGVVYEVDDAVQPALRVLLRRRPAEHRRRVARGDCRSTTLRRAFPERDGLQVSLTGGEIFVRKDIMEVLDLFRAEGLRCGYLTTNGTIIDDERADALADLALRGLPEAHQRVDRRPGRAARRGARREGHLRADRRRPPAAAGGGPARRRRRCGSASTRRSRAESLDALDRMVDVAEELGVDAIGLNHLMFATPEEVAETAQTARARPTRRSIATFVTPRPGRRRRPRCATQVAALQEKCREHGIRFDFRPKVWPTHLIERYYTPGRAARGRCLYPFLHARVGFSGKVYFCPFIRIEVGDLTRRRSRRSGTARATWNCGKPLARTEPVPRLPAVLQGGAVARTCAGRRHPAARRQVIALTPVDGPGRSPRRGIVRRTRAEIDTATIKWHADPPVPVGVRLRALRVPTAARRSSRSSSARASGWPAGSSTRAAAAAACRCRWPRRLTASWAST